MKELEPQLIQKIRDALWIAPVGKIPYTLQGFHSVTCSPDRENLIIVGKNIADSLEMLDFENKLFNCFDKNCCARTHSIVYVVGKMLGIQIICNRELPDNNVFVLRNRDGEISVKGSYEIDEKELFTIGQC